MTPRGISGRSEPTVQIQLVNRQATHSAANSHWHPAVLVLWLVALTKSVATVRNREAAIVLCRQFDPVGGSHVYGRRAWSPSIAHAAVVQVGDETLGHVMSFASSDRIVVLP